MKSKAPKVFLEGEVDAYASEGLWPDPTIGGKYLLEAMGKAGFNLGFGGPTSDVLVMLGVEPGGGEVHAGGGPLAVFPGFTGTDVTPPETLQIQVGDWNLAERLRELDGKTVAITVTEIGKIPIAEPEPPPVCEVCQGPKGDPDARPLIILDGEHAPCPGKLHDA